MEMKMMMKKKSWAHNLIKLVQHQAPESLSLYMIRHTTYTQVQKTSLSHEVQSQRA